MNTDFTNERRRLVAAAFLLFALLGAASTPVLGQSQTGQISGTLTDPAGAVIPGATVRLTHDLTGNTREFKTEANGAFVFPNLLPGNYTIRIEQTGFTAYEQKSINVSQSERVDLHEVPMAIGAVSTSVEVTTAAARVQTASSERAGLINPTQVDTLPNRGRDYLGLLRSLPGVLDTSNRNAPGDNGNPQVNGGQAGQFLVTLDGVPNQDVGFVAGAGFLTPSVDAIGEVKVMLSGSQAEFGARSGGQMSVAIKSGTKGFHGSVYYYWRHEMFNANTFNNNKLGVQKPKYRYKNPGYTVGGPVIIPGTGFNKNRDKLFFFWSHEMLFRHSTATNNLSFPTQLERSGDFSQSYDGSTNKLIVLRDPTTGNPIANNILPGNLQNAAGRAILNLFPLPMANITDPSGRHGYNAQYLLPSDQPNNNEILKIDYNVAKNTLAYGRYMRDYKGQTGGCAFYLICGTTWPMLDGTYNVVAQGVVGTVVHTFTPSLINETTYGVNFSSQNVVTDQASLANLDRDKRGLPQSVLPQFYPGVNTMNLIPVVAFTSANGGNSIPNSPTTYLDTRFPFAGNTRVHTISNNLSWVKGGHNMKAGFYMEHTQRWARRGAGGASGWGLFSGNYDFGSDPFNGSDTGWGYSNALAGVVRQYQEANRQGEGNASYNRIDWFAQDSWRVSRRLTIEYGVRFTKAQAVNSVGQPLAVFEISKYNKGQNPLLIKPACATGTNCPSGANRVAVDPVTGKLLPQTLIGALSNSAGTPYQAATVFQGSYFNSPGIAISPRFGFAWDVLGNGKLALRGGFDILYDATTTSVDDVLGLTDVPPATMIQTLNYTTLADMKTAPNYFRLAGMTAGSQTFKLPATLDWHVGLQRDLGMGLVLDVAYVANTTRHLPNTYDLNAIAPGTTWSGSAFTGFNPSVVDSTNNAVLPTDFLRPYQGYSSITYRRWSNSSNYNSLQTMLNRRFAKRLTLGGNYTFSRTITYGPTPFYDTQLTKSPGNTRKHNLNANWTYRIPEGSHIWSNAFTRFLMDNWQYSGFMTILSGSSASVSYSITGQPTGFNISGSPTTSLNRIQVVDPANIWATPKDSLDSGLNPTAFAIPALSTRGTGNGPPVLFWGPGQWSFDMSLFKAFKLSKEKARSVEFRAEAYNVFNHPNYGNPNTSFQTAWNNGNFGPNTNIYFGRYDSSAGTVAISGQPRVMVFALKVRF